MRQTPTPTTYPETPYQQRGHNLPPTPNRQVYNERRRHQSLLVSKMHITPRQAFETFPKAPSPTHPLDPDQIWARVLAYNRAHNPQAASKVKNGPGEAATSP